MADLNLSAFDYVLKYIMRGPIQNQFAEKIVFFKRIKRTAENIDASGRKVLMPILLNLGHSVGPRADGAVLPTPVNPTYYESQSTVRHNYATMSVTGPTIRASRKDSSAFARATTSEMKNKTLALKQCVESQFFGIGKGFIAELSAAYSGQTLICNTGDGVRHLKAGMVIDVVTSAGTEHATSLVISSINTTTNVVTVTGTVTSCVDGDYIVLENSYGIAIMGLQGIVDDDTLLSSLQGIDSGTYPEWQGKVYDNSGTNRTLDIATHLQPAFSYCEEEMGAPSIILTTYGLRDKYAALLTAQKMYVNTMKLDGGFTAVEYNGVPMLPVPMATKNKFFFLQESALEIAEVGDIDWADEDGSILHKKSTYDAYEADLYYDAEFVTERRNVHAVVADITE